MKKISRVFEQKKDKKYIETYRTEDRAKVYEDLACELLNLKVFKFNNYRSMTQHTNYDGTRTVIIYRTDGRSVYIIDD